MADKDTNVPNKNDFISREAAIALTDQHCFETSYDAVWMEEELRKLPSADVVARDCYDRILAENDTMREQLAQIGKKPLDRMDDVRPVVRARWEDETEYIFAVLAQRVHCPACKSYAYFYPGKTKNFCPTCGADMSENKNDQRGEQQGRENRKTLR